MIRAIFELRITGFWDVFKLTASVLNSCVHHLARARAVQADARRWNKVTEKR